MRFGFLAETLISFLILIPPPSPLFSIFRPSSIPFCFPEPPPVFKPASSVLRTSQELQFVSESNQNDPYDLVTPDLPTLAASMGNWGAPQPNIAEVSKTKLSFPGALHS